MFSYFKISFQYRFINFLSIKLEFTTQRYTNAFNMASFCNELLRLPLQCNHFSCSLTYLFISKARQSVPLVYKVSKLYYCQANALTFAYFNATMQQTIPAALTSTPLKHYSRTMSAYVCVKIVVLHFALFRVFSAYSQFPATVQTIVSIYRCHLFEYCLIWLPCGFCKIEQHCAYTEPLAGDSAQ